MSKKPDPGQPLARTLGLWGAVATGIGSIVGTGVFVSLGVAAGVAGPALLIALALAAGVAICNGLNSAQLAAVHPVSGGAYEYGYRLLNPTLGFTAGWSFMLAKAASAATAALGFGGYLLHLLGMDSSLVIPFGLGAVVILTAIVMAGMKRTTPANVVIVSATFLALAAFVIIGLPNSFGARPDVSFFESPTGESPVRGLLHATALMFVAYTGYGRIATLGEEVKDPAHTIPRAVIITLGLTMVLYMGVAFVGIWAFGAANLAAATDETAAPLEAAARHFGPPWLPVVVAVGAVTAMLGVLLNLLLGLSRVLLAMGRRRDAPAFLERVSKRTGAPTMATLVVGVGIAALVLIGDVRTTWSFSAFSVLIYYSITNLAALKLTANERRYPRWLAWLGLAACVFLAFWVDVWVWVIGLGVVAAGVAINAAVRHLRTSA
ncbi:APC family permease [soil metagenome]